MATTPTTAPVTHTWEKLDDGYWVTTCNRWSILRVGGGFYQLRREDADPQRPVLVLEARSTRKLRRWAAEEDTIAARTGIRRVYEHPRGT